MSNKLNDLKPSAPISTSTHEHSQDNKYLALGFWEFAIISTLFVCFFPLSLLFCWLYYGIEDTVLLVKALLHDFVRTILIVIGIIISLIVFLGLILLSIS